MDGGDVGKEDEEDIEILQHIAIVIFGTEIHIQSKVPLN